MDIKSVVVMWDTDSSVSRVQLKDIQFKERDMNVMPDLPTFKENYKPLLPRDKSKAIADSSSLVNSNNKQMWKEGETVAPNLRRKALKKGFCGCICVHQYSHDHIQNVAWYDSMSDQIPVDASHHDDKKYPPTFQDEQLAGNHRSLGLKADADIYQGADIGEYVGDLVVEARDGNKEYMMLYRDDLTPPLFIDARLRGNLMRFVNHSCDPNAEVIGGSERNGEANSVERLYIRAKKDIKRGEFITIKYNEVNFVCKCGAENCIDRK